MLKSCNEFFFSNLTKFTVVDEGNNAFGHVGDMLLNKNMTINSLIIYGSFFEEKLEALGLREDIDEVVRIEDVEEDVDKKLLKVNKKCSELKTTGKDWKPPADVYQFTKLKKIPVYDSSNNKIGRIIDIGFCTESGKYTLVLGGSWLEEFLEDIRIFANKDLLVPSQLIKEFNEEKIVITTDKVNLKTTLKEEARPTEILEIKKPTLVDRGYSTRFTMK